jgi:hypothetical protein
MGEWAGILDELMAQAARVADALDRARALVGGELLVAKTVSPSLRQAGTSRGR